MVLRFKKYLLYPLAWCFVASTVIASMEAITYFIILDGLVDLTLPDFLYHYSVSIAVMGCTLAITWGCFLVFAVWLGSMRAGLAIFMLLYTVLMASYLMHVLNIVFAYTDKYAPYWGLLTRYFLSFAVISAVFFSLILGKITRNRNKVLTLRPFTIIALQFFALICILWLRNTSLPQLSGGIFITLYLALALLSILLLWFLFASPRRLQIFLIVVFLLCIAPLLLFKNNPAAEDAVSTEGAPAAAQAKHVVLITVDTLRRDALGCYNAEYKGQTPQIDGLAEDSTVFTKAFSAAPWTCPSVSSILTGLRPQVHQMITGKGALTEKAPTLAEAMQQGGYHTSAIGFNGLLQERSKLNRGFKEYHWYPMQKYDIEHFGVGLTHELIYMLPRLIPDASGMTDHAIEWVQENRERDFFLWLHYFDPHTPYKPPVAHQPKQGGDGREMEFHETRAARMGSTARSVEDRDWIRALYQGEVRFIDAELGRFLEALRSLNLYDSALIVFTSDHGEEFWDHDLFEHGQSLYNELVNVPFFIKSPHSSGQDHIEDNVSTQAIMPTILELCHISPEYPEGLMSSLSPMLSTAAPHTATEPIYIGSSLFHDRLEGVVFDSMKYIHGTLSGHEWLFNLEADPEERNSLIFQDAENLERGRQLLEQRKEEDARFRDQLGIDSDEEEPLDPESIRSLEALGYL
ncbi:MAG: sulfatase [Candidatus Hydrogenedentes bacterium]|nr:sulfatase [Candidatus Hydrogenedentota bacterium]